MRNVMKGLLLSFMLVCIPLEMEGQNNLSAKELSSQFADPDREYAPMAWWHWINGHVTKSGIRKDLIAMQEVGIRGVQVFNVGMYMPEGAIRYGSDEWIELNKFAIELCDSLNMKFTLTNAPGWSGSGGPWITKELAMKRIVFSETKVTGGTNVSVVIKQPASKLDFYEDIATVAIPAEFSSGMIDDLESKILMSNGKPLNVPLNQPGKVAIPFDQVIDLSSNIDGNGNLLWNAPQGGWTVIRFGYTLTGSRTNPPAVGGEGLEVDKLDKSAVSYHFDHSIGKLISKTGNFLGKTFEGILVDSYESGYQNWTKSLPEEFLKRRGYSIIPYLPLFTGRYVESVQQSEQVLYDFRTVLDELFSQNYFGTLQRKANENKLILYAEGQGGPLSQRLVTKYLDVPMIEFWNFDSRDWYWTPKMRFTASCANLERKNIVAAEAFASRPESGKWQNTPWTLKRVGDLAFAGGVNRLCFHTYTHQPYDLKPGFTMGRYGTILSRHTTWWNFASPWIGYLTRCQFLLQQGETVSDIAFLFHNDIRNAFARDTFDVPQGFTYDFIYPDDLKGAVFADEHIVLSSGRKYRVLKMRENELICFETLQILHELVGQGGVLIGAPSKQDPSFAKKQDYRQEDYRKLISALYGGLDGKTNIRKNVGKGKVYWGSSLNEVLNNQGILPDITFLGEKMEMSNLHYIHRKLSDGKDIFFISNQNLHPVSPQVIFRDMIGCPQIWDPSNGEIVEVSQFTQTDEGVESGIDLDARGSCFVVFGNGGTYKKAFKDVFVDVIPFNKKWTLSFEDKKQMPDSLELSVTKLSSWHKSSDERIKYYSGTANYTNRFTLNIKDFSQNYKYHIELSGLYDIAEIIVNGKRAGMLWKTPYKLDVSNYLQTGTNTVSIRVANTWINRLIGDEQMPADLTFEEGGSIFTDGRILQFPTWLASNRMPVDRKRHTFTTWRHYRADSPLVPSGLVGDVSIVRFRPTPK